jgi:DNA polymerase-4
MRWIVHVDMDAYFASVEQAVDPRLRGKPVVVGGRPNSRGVVTAASYEARPFGIRSGMPIAAAVRRCPHAVFLPGNFALYVHTSKRIFEVLREFTPRVEPASVDEAYLDLDDGSGDDAATAGAVIAARSLGARIQAAIGERIGLGASLGVAATKFLAKMASGWEKPRGLTVVTRADVPVRLWPLPVVAMYGVGAKTEARLHRLGYVTVGDLARAPDGQLERQMGAYGALLARRARGDDGGRVVPPEEGPDARSIGCEQTLSRDESDRERIEALLAALATRVGRRARRHAFAGRRVVLKLRDPSFATITHGRVVPQPVDADADLVRIARELLAETRFWERGVRLLGVSLQQLVRTDHGRQLAFDFSAINRALPAMDAIRSKYGEHAIAAARILEAGSEARRGPTVTFAVPE